MKNTIKYMTMAFFALTGSLYAQEIASDTRENLIFGPKIGANYSNVYDSGDAEFNADGKLGFAGGAFLAIPIGKYIGIQPELLFSQKGLTAKGNILGFGYELSRTTNYLDIPIFFALKPSEFITILAGPQFSYLLSQKDTYTNGLGSSSVLQEFNNDDARKNTLCFVGGVDINVKRIVVGARVGFDVLSNAGSGSSYTPRYKNIWAQLTVGYRFY